MCQNLPFTKCLHPVKVKTLRGIQLVKCGKCPACENSKRSEFRAKVQFEENNSLACFFITNTYSDDNLPLFCLRNDLIEESDKQYDKSGNIIDDEFYRSLKPVKYTDINGFKRSYDGSFSLASPVWRCTTVIPVTIAETILQKLAFCVQRLLCRYV